MQTTLHLDLQTYVVVGKISKFFPLHLLIFFFLKKLLLENRVSPHNFFFKDIEGRSH